MPPDVIKKETGLNLYFNYYKLNDLICLTDYLIYFRSIRLILRTVIGISVLVFLISSVLSAYYTRVYCSFKNPHQTKCHTYQITAIRIAITDSLFLVFGCTLSYYLFKLAKLSLQNSIPEQNVS